MNLIANSGRHDAETETGDRDAEEADEESSHRPRHCARGHHAPGPAYLRDRVHAAFDAFITAVLAAAIGVRHLYAKDAATPVLGPE